MPDIKFTLPYIFLKYLWSRFDSKTRRAHGAVARPPGKSWTVTAGEGGPVRC